MKNFFLCVATLCVLAGPMAADQSVQQTVAPETIVPEPVAPEPVRPIEPAGVVLPSEAEGFGLVLIEAMASGIPVVATDAPGIRDVVRHEVTGLLVPVAAPRELAAAMQRIIEDPALRNQLVERGKVEVRERFSWDAVLPAYRSLLRIPP